MKTAQVTHIYLPHIGGLEFYVKRLADSLLSHGVNTTVLTTDMNTSRENRKAEAQYFKTSWQYMRNPFSFDFIRHLQKQDYDILHLHSVWFLHGLLAVLFRKKARIISTIHGVYPDNLSLTLKIFLTLYKPFINYVLKKSEVIFVYSAIEEEKLKRIFKTPPEKIVILPMAINVESYEDTPKKKTILFTGRIIPDKNPELLIKAAALLENKFQDYKIVFVGYAEPAFKEKLLSLAQERNVKNEILFAGHLDPSIEKEKDELMNHYRTASVFTSLGSWEGQPTRLMEAMQFKTPVIAFAAGGTADFVFDNINGMIINELDERLLAEKIEMILSDESLAKKLGEEARKTIMKDYNWDKAYQIIAETYKKVYIG
jgi:glycosyltransferase involved in cell wall biosynthesis